MEKTKISIEATIKASPEKVWKLYTEPEHITKWNTASPDWHTTRAENDLQVGGKFLSRMEAKDGSFGFDFWGIYDEVAPAQLLSYTLGDGRKAKIDLKDQNNSTHITLIFEAENENPIELQRNGWQAILNNFKNYAETI